MHRQDCQSQAPGWLLSHPRSEPRPCHNSIGTGASGEGDNVTTEKKPSLVLPTPSFAQAQAEKADNVTTKKKQRPVSTDKLLVVAVIKYCRRACSIADVPELPRPFKRRTRLRPCGGVINENYTNFRMGPLKKPKTSGGHSAEAYAGLEF